MSGQLESPHFFRTGDVVQDLNGSTGIVGETSTLYAVVAWGDGRNEEVDQFDARLVVIRRAEPA